MTQTNRKQDASHALMVRVDWTTAQVVKITAARDITLDASTVDTSNRHIIADAPINVQAGTTLYLAASDDLVGWYYVCRVNAAGVVSCGCPGHKCKHQARVSSFINKPAATPAKWDESDEQAHVEDDLTCSRIVDGKLEACRWNDLTPEEQYAASRNDYYSYDAA